MCNARTNYKTNVLYNACHALYSVWNEMDFIIIIKQSQGFKYYLLELLPYKRNEEKMTSYSTRVIKTINIRILSVTKVKVYSLIKCMYFLYVYNIINFSSLSNSFQSLSVTTCEAHIISCHSTIFFASYRMVYTLSKINSMFSTVYTIYPHTNCIDLYNTTCPPPPPKKKNIAIRLSASIPFKIVYSS